MIIANDNKPGYVQATLILAFHDGREEYREAIAADIDGLRGMAEAVYHSTPALLAVGLWFETSGDAMVFNGPRLNH